MDIEKTMEFILAVQAKLDASVQEHNEQIAKNSEQIAKNSEQIAKLEAKIASVTDLVGRLAQAEIRLAESTTAGFRDLRELHANTESKLNALIDTVGKLVRRNGHKE
jgi:UDP-N-acetylglucosamine enolpyruvyl transferase